jgi:tetratricopeptide (TPR) repeat protein
MCVGLDCSPAAQRAALTGSEGQPARVDGALLAVFDSIGAALAAAALAERRAGEREAPRIGIAHGDVTRLADGLDGPASREALALASQARAGQVLVADVVQLLAHKGHRFVRRPPGVDSQPVWELVWKGGARVPLPDGLLAAGVRGTFVGRDGELEHLLTSVDLVRSGERRVALLTGEPGIGKTRLAAELALAAHSEGAWVLYGRCDEGLGIPYQPFAESLAHLVAHAPDEVLDAAGPSLGELASLVPAVRARYGRGGAPEATRPGERYQLFGAIAALLSAPAEHDAVVLVLDDLHWADPQTVSLVRHLLAAPNPMRLLVVGTLRPVDAGASPELSDALGQLRRDERATRIELGGLEEREVLAVVEEIAGGELDRRERAYARMLHRETGGNPLFVSEVVRDLAGRDEIARRADALDANGDSALLPVPASVREVIAARAARLGSEALAVIETAGVVGREFDAALLAQVLDTDEERLGELLDGAERAAILVPVAGRPGRFSFVHPLIGRTLAERVGAARRARLHRSVAEALERLEDGPPPAARAAELLGHWSAASPPDPERVLRYAELAGRHALEQLDPQAAVRWLGQALELQGGEGDRHRCALLIAMGTAQRKHGDAGFRETLLDAARLARKLGDKDLLIGAVIENTRGFVSASGEIDAERVVMLEAALEVAGEADSRERAVLLAMLASELAFAAERARRTRLSDEAVAVARRLGDAATLCQVLSSRSVPIWAPDTLEDRLACSAESVRLADELGDALAQFHALHWRGVVLVQNGDLDEATRVVARKGELARRLGEPSARWMACYDEANLAIIGGRLEEAEGLANEALEIAMESGQPDAVPFYANQLTNIRYDQGRLAELQPMIAETTAATPGIPGFRALLGLAYVEAELPADAAELLAAEPLDAFPEDLTWLAGMVIWAHVCAAVGDSARADDLYGRLEPFAAQVVYTGVSAWGDVDHALGRLATVAERFDDAARHLAASAERYARIGAPVWLARAALDEAVLRLAREGPGDREQARELLARAEREARRLGAAGIERRAAVLRGHEEATGVLATRALHPPAPGGGDRPDARRAGLALEGEVWMLTHAGQSFHLKDSKGMGYLARLLEAPHSEVHVLELQAGGAVPEPDDGGSVGPMLDAEAKRAYRERLVQLEEELEEAERFNDPTRAERAQLERELIAQELARAVGLGGRDRPSGSAAERARVNATRAIRGAIKRIEECDPALGRHLDRAVRTGSFCAYDPSPQDEVSWELTA